MELTSEDVQEYEALKKKAEEKQKKLAEIERKNRLGSSAASGKTPKAAGGGEAVTPEADSEAARIARARAAAHLRREKRHGRNGFQHHRPGEP